jgi:hypothetical protein
MTEFEGIRKTEAMGHLCTQEFHLVIFFSSYPHLSANKLQGYIRPSRTKRSHVDREECRSERDENPSQHSPEWQWEKIITPSRPI